MKKICVLQLFLLWASLINHAQDAVADFIQVLKNAESASSKKDWHQASLLWQEVTRANPVNAWYWYNRAEATFESGEYDSAIYSFREALHLGASTKADCLFQISKCYAKKGNREEAYQSLQQSYDAGARSYQFAIDEPSFASYQNDPAFRKILGLPEKEIRDRNEGWRFDLLFLQKEIMRKAVKPFRFSPEKIDSEVKTIYADIPRLTDFQIVISLMKLLTLVNDGHTMVYPFSENMEEFHRNLPLEFCSYKEGLFIISADKRFETLIGSRVLAVEGKKIAEVMHLLDPVMFRDNERGPLVLGPFLLRMVALLQVLGIAAKPNELRLDLEDESGKKEMVSIPADSKIASRFLWDGLPEGWVNYFQKAKMSPPRFAKNVYKPFWFEWLDSNNAVYFQFNRIEPEGPDHESFEKFTTRLFDFIDQHDVRKLIIDIRINNGGNTFLLVNFMQKLMACKKVCNQGSLFILIGTRTYSAAQNFSTFLERWTPAIFVGEPTGSSPNFVGEELGFRLPYSGLYANISDRFHQSSWPEDNRIWTAPMLYIPSSFSDYRRGLDPAFEAVLKWK